MDETEANRRIADYALEAARRSGVPEPQRSDGRNELESHLFEMARAHSGGQPLQVGDAEAAIHRLGPAPAVEAAFFPGKASAPLEVGWGPRFGAVAIDYALVVGTLALLFSLLAATACVGAADGCRVEARFIPWPFIDDRSDALGAQSGDIASRADFLNTLEHVTFFLAPVIYSGLFEARMGATPGKLAMGLRVVALDGGPIPLAQAFGRNATKALLPFPFLIPVLLVADVVGGRLSKDRAGDRLFARWTGTRVVSANSTTHPATTARTRMG